MSKEKYSIKALYLSLFFSIFYLVSFSQENKDYYRFVDSADVYIDVSAKKSLAFLDSIPNPVEKNIKGRLADYFSIKALINDGFKEYSKLHQNYILALKYAEEENNCEVAGEACLELYANMHYIENDSTALKYLERAKQHYESCDYEYGILEVEQAYAYIEFLNANYEACNNLIFKNLDRYKRVEDAYYYLFATYMLTSNYLYLDDFVNANKYFNEFKLLKTNTSFTQYNYSSFEAALYVSMADIYFSKNQIDSTFHYLNKSSKLFNYMGGDVVESYYEISADAYKFSGNIDISKSYIDSLMIFQGEMYKKNLDASIQINDSLSKVEAELYEENEKKLLNRTLVIILMCVLIISSFFYLFFRKKNKSKINDFENQASNFSYLKSNNEKLTVKVQGLEDYISNLKKEVKIIAAIDDVSRQRNAIKNFYKTLHFDASTLLDKTENHLELVNDLNVDFFKKIHQIYPQLNNSEVIICYYLFIGFKNKEISVFLNTTIRAIESKRYRIAKKLQLENITLLEHLKSSF